jgi:hypothetical protein
VKNKVIVILLCIFIVETCLIGCNNHRECIAVPDKIIIYSDGKEKAIQKSDVKTGEITKITNKRLNPKVSNKNQCVNEEFISKIKNESLSVEFIYIQEQEMDIIGDGAKQFRYTRLFFPVQIKGPRSEKECLMYYGDGRKYFNNPMENLYYDEDLVNVLWDLK